jgi:hypothetical protein
MYHEVEIPELRAMAVWAPDPAPKNDVRAVVVRLLVISASCLVSGLTILWLVG